MNIVAAYLLLGQSKEKNAQSKANVEKVLKSVNAKYEPERLDAFFKEIEGKDVDQLIQEGLKKVETLGAAASAAAPAAAAAGGDAAAAGDSKKKDEPEEEEDDDMGFGLFD
eukprot:TRINITY_DN3489_c0_g3_i1.p2 TRINITY_DN3489_c0_g3~~TRINITY_DN3489_c0_g3_i1.p2  ORF type:complete len:111 (-),score=43.77 TRINITY_DN3489_c0_g3_i1:46-378(-)